MKLIVRTFLSVVLFVGFSTLCLAQEGNASNVEPSPPIKYNADNWKVFYSVDASFHVKMPGKPSQSTMEIATPSGNLPHHVYLLRTDAGNFMVTYTEFSVLQDDSERIRQILEGVRNTFIKDKSKKLLNERDVKIEGYAGRELLVEDGDNFLTCRTFLTRTRAYEIMLYVPRQSAFKSGRASSDRSDFTDFYELIATQFFDSFKLMNGGSATVYGSSATVDGRTRIVRGGVINGKAVKLPRPPYPDSARAAGVQGTVAVQVLIDEDGKVIEAKAVSGDPKLRAAAEKAAHAARFTPTKLEGVPVKVSGIINYNFALH